MKAAERQSEDRDEDSGLRCGCLRGRGYAAVEEEGQEIIGRESVR